MYAIIEIGGCSAMIQGGQWFASDQAMEDLLQRETNATPSSGSDPCPDITEARRIAKLYKGRVVKVDYTDPSQDDPPGKLY